MSYNLPTVVRKSFPLLLIFLFLMSFPLPSYSQDPLPQPYDSTLNYNLTTSCVSFFKSFKSDSNFQKCNSFGFLVLSSNQFLTKSRNASQIPPIMDQICAPENSMDKCKSDFANFAQQMTQENNCRTDLQNVNPIASQAYVSFMSYEPLQIVGCLKNSNGTYCYVSALYNKRGIKLFLLPSGSAMPQDQELACTECNQKILNTYASYDDDNTLPLYQVFPQVRDKINEQCGTGWVDSPANVKTNSIGRVEVGSILVKVLIGLIGLMIASG